MRIVSPALVPSRQITVKSRAGTVRIASSKNGSHEAASQTCINQYKHPSGRVNDDDDHHPGHVRLVWPRSSSSSSLVSFQHFLFFDDQTKKKITIPKQGREHGITTQRDSVLCDSYYRAPTIHTSHLYNKLEWNEMGLWIPVLDSLI